MTHVSRLSLPFALAVLAAAVAPRAHADAVTDWNARAADVAHAACLADNPIVESRLYAMVQIAVHDAANAIQRHSKPYAYAGQAPAGASFDAAVATAAHHVLVDQVQSIGVPPECAAAARQVAEREYAAAMGHVTGPGKQDGVTAGRNAAAAILARRAGDGSQAPLVDDKFPQGKSPGQWRFTPGSPPIAFGPSWGKVAPFALASAAQFRPPPPLPVECAQRSNEFCVRYARDVEEVRRLGGDGKSAPTARTADQTQVALFWEESSPTSWNRLAREVSAREKLGPWDNARLFALLATAMADGYIASWSTKYHYLFWRPVTAIREGATDRNAGPRADPNWNSLRPTPPVPDYESAHAVQGAAAAAVLKAVFGRDDVAFSACSNSLPEGRCGDAKPVRRSFTSFSAAARENGLSRIYIGFHFRDAVDKGLQHGDAIGRWTVANTFAPEH